MKTKHGLSALQARARGAAARRTNARVVVSREVATNEQGEPVASRTAELWLYGTVGGYWWGFDSDDVADALRAMGDVDEILVRLHSFGGSSIEGIAIANLLANHPANIRIVVDGLAASAASMIALAANELVMSPGSQFMIHDVWTCMCGNEAELRAEADRIGRQSQNYAETYAVRGGGTAEQWREAMRAGDGEGTWYSAQEVVDAGWATEVANIASTTAPPPMPDIDDIDDDIELAAAAEWDLEVLLHPAARAAMSTWRRTGAPKPPTASAGGSTPTQGGTAVSFTDAQLTTMRATLELPADADEATILAALETVVAESLEDQPPAAPAAAVKIPEGFSLVDDGTLAAMRVGAEDGRAARTQQLTEHRDRTIQAAISAGKIPPARKEHYEAAWKGDASGTEQLLATLAPGLVPVEERGHAQTPAEETTATVDDAALGTFASQLGLTKEDLRG
jgi:ATP-dependent protease ClpP protease subunit